MDEARVERYDGATGGEGREEGGMQKMDLGLVARPERRRGGGGEVSK